MILTAYSRSWERSLRAANKAPKTIKVYTDAVRYFDTWLDALPASYDQTMDKDKETRRDREDSEFARLLTPPGDLPEVGHRLIQAYISCEVARTSAGNASNLYRALQQFFKWAHLEEEIDANPFARLEPPAVPEKPVPVIPDDGLKKLLGACKGRDLVSLRDTAIIMLFLDTGIRRSELANLRYHPDDPEQSDVDFTMDVLHIIAKGRRPRAVPFGNKAGIALERYVRERAKHAAPTETALWIGSLSKGGMTGSGIAQMLERRCDEAKISPRVHPHQFRHTFSHQWLATGGSETDLMRLNGWTSRQMLNRYGASAAHERAINAHRKNSPADRL